MRTPEEKAMVLVGRYARLQVRSAQCRKTCGKLLDACENLREAGDGEDAAWSSSWSGCMEAYRQWKSGAAKGYESRPNSQQGWNALLEQDLEFCRACLLAMKVWRHRKAMHRRRAGVLNAMKRLGAAHQPKEPSK